MSEKKIVQITPEDNTIAVDGRLNVNGHIQSLPVAGSWYPMCNGPAGSGTYTKINLDTEGFNTSPDHFTMENQGIAVHESGYYRIDACCLVNLINSWDYAHFYLHANDSQIDVCHGERSSVETWKVCTINWIGYISSGTNINAKVFHSEYTSHYYHGGNSGFTRLDIQKMN